MRHTYISFAGKYTEFTMVPKKETTTFTVYRFVFETNRTPYTDTPCDDVLWGRVEFGEGISKPSMTA